MQLKTKGTFNTLKCFKFRGTLTSVFGVFGLWREVMKRESERRESDQLVAALPTGAYTRSDRNSHGQAPKFRGENCSHVSDCTGLNAPLKFRRVSIPEFKEVVAAAVRY